MPENIRDKIVAERRTRIARLGHTEGAEVPKRREAPITPFLGENGLICEVKRRSPSKGDIAPGLDAVDQAGRYLEAGCANLSILTVPEGFGGSLEDLIRVKRAFPRAAVLRKDFLFDVRDVEVAWRAGADAVLLIAGILEAGELEKMYRHAKGLGLEALVEIHDRDDLAKAARFEPNLVGINSRDLTTFRIDPLLPVKVKAGIAWNARVVYESGVSSPDQAAFAASAGFRGLLIGEAAMKNPALPGQVLEAMRTAPAARFWPEIGKRLREGGTLVKICGLTREGDARLAADLGADALGFVFWSHSPRRAEPALLRALKDIQTPKIGVVVNPAGAGALDPAVRRLLEEGLLDAVQLHGDETPDDCARLWPVGYKALRPGNAAGLGPGREYRCPRLLLDAATGVPGGSGKRIGADILDAWREPLWLAGGITPDNAGEITASRRPELLDVASGVEEAPGVKSADKMGKIIREIRNA